MAVVQLSHAPSRADYDKVAQEVNLEADVPAGLICHIAAETASGEILIVDVWESPQALQSFGEQRIFPAFRTTGNESLMAGEPPTQHEAFELVLGSQS